MKKKIKDNPLFWSGILICILGLLPCIGAFWIPKLIIPGVGLISFGGVIGIVGLYECYFMRKKDDIK